MKELVVFNNLQVLDLNRTQVGDYGMKEVARLTNLRALKLWETQVTDDGLKELGQLKNLQGLELYQARRISGAGLKGLAGLKLKWLQLPAAAKTDIGLKNYLAAVEAPTYLNLSAWHITNAGLKELAGLTTLQTLHISGTQITDAGLKNLTDLKSLKTLALRLTSVTDTGIAELRIALPACRISK